MRSQEKVLSIVLLAVVSATAACSSGGGSDGGVVTGPPEGVAGIWTLQITNAGAAELTGCTGSLVPLEGLTLAEVLAAGPACTDPGPLTVTQSDTVFTLLPAAYTCDDGQSNTYGGVGTVRSASLTGHLDTNSNMGWSALEYFTGGVAGLSVSLSESRITYSGSQSGACNFSPQVNYSGVIVQAGLTAPGTNSLPISCYIDSYLERPVD